MNTLELKSDVHTLIDKINDINILNAIKTLLSKQVAEADFWNELPLNAQESILKGIKQAENGETKSHEEVMGKYQKWL